MKTVVEQSFEKLVSVFTTQIDIGIGGIKVSLADCANILLAFLAVICICRVLRNSLRNRLLPKLGIDEGNREAIATMTTTANSEQATERARVHYNSENARNLYEIAIGSDTLNLGMYEDDPDRPIAEGMNNCKQSNASLRENELLLFLNQCLCHYFVP